MHCFRAQCERVRMCCCGSTCTESFSCDDDEQSALRKRSCAAPTQSCRQPGISDRATPPLPRLPRRKGCYCANAGGEHTCSVAEHEIRSMTVSSQSMLVAPATASEIADESLIVASHSSHSGSTSCSLRRPMVPWTIREYRPQPCAEHPTKSAKGRGCFVAEHLCSAHSVLC